jgi:hypothetical protein
VTAVEEGSEILAYRRSRCALSMFAFVLLNASAHICFLTSELLFLASLPLFSQLRSNFT